MRAKDFRIVAIHTRFLAASREVSKLRLTAPYANFHSPIHNEIGNRPAFAIHAPVLSCLRTPLLLLFLLIPTTTAYWH